MKNLLYTFLIIISFFIQSKNAFTQDKIETSFEQKDDKIFIYYTLNGDSQKEYEIEKVVLRRKNNSTFQLIPSDLTGDVGNGKYAISKRTIVWTVNEDEQNIIAENADAGDFQIEIVANVITERSSGSSWLYYVGGAALLGGGAAAILLLKGKNETSSSTAFPEPPGRP